jgi:hypothetical protein
MHGVAFDATILVIRADSNDPALPGQFEILDILAALNYAAGKAHVINMSFGVLCIKCRKAPHRSADSVDDIRIIGQLRDSLLLVEGQSFGLIRDVTQLGDATRNLTKINFGGRRVELVKHTLPVSLSTIAAEFPSIDRPFHGNQFFLTCKIVVGSRNVISVGCGGDRK